jgi:RimJ/RimL family protein N-acetyltransferase
MAEVIYRPAGLADAALAADLMTAAFPREPEDPVLTRFRWDHPRGGWSNSRFIASVDGTPVAYLSSAHAFWEKNAERHGWVEVNLDRARMDVGLLTQMWEWIGATAEADGALVLNAEAAAEQTEAQAVLAKLGYELERTDKVWELDLRAHGERLRKDAAAARDKLTVAGIELTTLAEWRPSDKFARVHALNELTRLDIPTSVPIVPESLESWLQRSNPPDRPHDRWWLAVDGDQPIAMSYLSFPPVRGHVWTHYTCCHPDYRGRGIARGVKLQSLAQAAELGVPSVRTDNDSENAAMLHINETLGYKAMPGFSAYQKRVRS